MDDDIKHLTKRIKLAKQEIKLKPESSYLETYIFELEQDLEQYKENRDKAEASISNSNIPPDMLSLIRGELKEFISGIWTYTPDVQHNILKKYVISVSSVLEKQLYCNLE